MIVGAAGGAVGKFLGKKFKAGKKFYKRRSGAVARAAQDPNAATRDFKREEEKNSKDEEIKRYRKALEELGMNPDDIKKGD